MLYLSVTYLYLKFLENRAILSGLNAMLLNFLDSLKVVELNLNDILKSSLTYRGC